MKDILKILFFICLVTVLNLNCQAQQNNPLRVDGFVTDVGGRPLTNVHILNMSAKTGTTSNQDGSFRISAVSGDILLFRCMGYQNRQISIPGGDFGPVYPVHVLLQTDTLQLSGVTIYAWPRNMTELRQAVLNQKVEPPIIAELNLNVRITDPPPQGPPSSIPGMVDPGLTYTISGPITMLYDKFSRRGKSLQKFKELTGNDQLNALIAKKYNPQVVKEITGFTSDEEIREFIEYCNLSTEFLLTATDYEILRKVKECLAAYLAENH